MGDLVTDVSDVVLLGVDGRINVLFVIMSLTAMPPPNVAAFEEEAIEACTETGRGFSVFSDDLLTIVICLSLEMEIGVG